MPKPVEKQCKVCQLYTEDRLNIEDRLKEGWSLNKTLRYIENELGYKNISRSSLYRHKRHMDRVCPPYIPKPELYIAITKPKGKPLWQDISRYRP